MFLIVAHHLQVHSVHSFEEDENEIPIHVFNKNFFNILFVGGKVSVNIFLLLSGYFLKGKGIKLASLLRTWIQAIVWSYILFFLACLRRHELTRWDCIKSLFPVSTYSYWFVSSYIAAMLLSPGTAVVSENTSELDLLIILVTQFLVMSALSWNQYAFSHVFWFVYVSLLGASMRRFESRLYVIRTSAILVAFLAVASVVVGSVLYFTVHPEIQWARDRGGATALTADMNSPCALFLAILSFLLFSRMKFQSNIINILASCTLGVYFIHDNDLWRETLWHDIIRSHEYQSSTFLATYSVVSVTTLYCVCSLLEFTRQMLMKNIELSLASRLQRLLERSHEVLVESEPTQLELQEIALSRSTR